jgi:hypothetical protein
VCVCVCECVCVCVCVMSPWSERAGLWRSFDETDKVELFKDGPRDGSAIHAVLNMSQLANFPY